MDDYTLNTVYSLALEFRKGIDKIRWGEIKGDCDITPWKRFPEGSCSDASILLGEYLWQKMNLEFGYISGEKKGANGQGLTHAWVEYNGTIVDITADQFTDNDKLPCVIVTNKRDWHDQFNSKPTEEPMKARTTIYGCRKKYCYDRILDIIKNNI